MIKKVINKKSKGFTLIEIIVTLGLAVLGLLAITQLFRFYLQTVADEKFRVTAAVLANQKIETIRNLPYDDIGTIGGIPPGNLVQEEKITKNGKSFTVKTEVIYIDDPFDGTISSAGTNNSIYNTSNSDLIYYWSMESNSSGQSPDIGSGTLITQNVTIDTGKQGNGLYFNSVNHSKVTTTSANNINPIKGRIGFWYKPTDDFDGYFFKADADSYFRLREKNGTKIQFNYGQSGSITSPPLSWNQGQWYFIEVAWDATDTNYVYRELWRDGVPLALKINSITPPSLNGNLYFGARGDSHFLNGTMDEFYVLDEPYKFEVWGYNQSNPYLSSIPMVSFYWNMNSGASSQTPQKGSGTTSLGGDYEVKSPAVKNDGLSLMGFYDTDYAQIPTENNIDFSNGRVAFWYNPRKNSVYSYNNPFLLNASCTDGIFKINRKNNGQLEFTYGNLTNSNSISSQPLNWDKKWWYFIEIAFNKDNNYLGLFINRQEVASDSTTNLSEPTGCSSLFLGNKNSSSVYNGEGNFDELFILNTSDPNSSTQDTLNTDYKRVKVTVSWNSNTGEKKVYAITDIAPPGIETTAGGGTLIFHVFDADGLPVANADISIVNNTLNPPINMDLTTNTDGNLILPGAPATSSSYEITVTKSGYSSDYTMAATSTYVNPVRDHLNVIEGETTEASFAIDKTSNILVSSVSQSFPVNWQINTDNSETNQFNAALANNDSYAYFAWEDFRTSSTSLIYANRYTLTGGSPWSSDTLIKETQNQSSPRLTIDNNENQYIVWSDDSLGNENIFISKLTSSGTNSWGDAYKVNSDTGNANQINPDLIYLNDEIYIVWQDDRNDGGDIYFNKFNSSGTKLLSNDIKINSDNGTAKQENPLIIAGSDNALYIAWLDNRNGSEDIYLHKLDTNGSPIWANEVKINTNLATNINSFDLTIDNDDNNYLVWSDNRNGNYDIYWQKVASTTDIGFSNDQLITTSAQDNNQEKPKIASDDNSDLYIGWQDDRSGSQDVYIYKIDNQGNALWPQEIRINIENNNDQIINDISTYSTDRVIAVWTDYSQNDTNIWAGTLNYDGSETAIPYVDFHLTGSKLTHENPDRHKFEHDYTTNAQGELLISDLEWDTYTVTVTDPSYTLLQSEPASPFSLIPATSTTLKLIID